jgi:hypothetical protein
MEIGTQVVGFVLQLGLLSIISKMLVDKYLERHKSGLQKDVEQYKSELRVAADSQIERVKVELQLFADTERNRRDALIEISELVERSFRYVNTLGYTMLLADGNDLPKLPITINADLPKELFALHEQISEWQMKNCWHFEGDDMLYASTEYNLRLYGYYTNLEAFFRSLLEGDSASVNRYFDNMTKFEQEVKQTWAHIRMLLSASRIDRGGTE